MQDSQAAHDSQVAALQATVEALEASSREMNQELANCQERASAAHESMEVRVPEANPGCLCDCILFSGDAAHFSGKYLLCCSRAELLALGRVERFFSGLYDVFDTMGISNLPIHTQHAEQQGGTPALHDKITFGWRGGLALRASS